ncbi:unnamed protein product, partial [Owenia fusiformis]|uniref:G-protein coupled receptors family 1 profile domain-containing protein n=1 Tax=Owenia fusiformis TaxID=6347 RepID=A0A8J1TU95_OWEFU
MEIHLTKTNDSLTHQLYNVTVNDMYAQQALRSRLEQNETYLRLLIFGGILCFIAVLANIISIFAIRQIPGKMTANHLMFVNLSVADAFAALMYYLWIVSIVLISWKESHLRVIFYMTYLTHAGYVLFYVASNLSLLMFAIYRYLAIYRPISFSDVSSLCKICGSLTGVWIVSVLIAWPGTFPLFVRPPQPCIYTETASRGMTTNPTIVLHTSAADDKFIAANSTERTPTTVQFEEGIGYSDVRTNCDSTQEFVESPGMSFENLYNYWNYIWPGVMILSFLTIVVLYILVSRYLHRRSARWRSERNMDENLYAFITTVFLMTTLTISIVPYFTYMMIRFHNVHADQMILIRVYYNFIVYLPWINFISDPIIYGYRTKNIRDGYFKIAYNMSSCFRSTFRYRTGPRTSVSYSRANGRSSFSTRSSITATTTTL